MKTKRISYYYPVFSVIIGLVFFLSIKFQSSIVEGDGCGVWQVDQNSALEFRTCTDTDDPRFKSYQFFNGYNFEVHILCEMNFSDGSSNRSGMYVGPGARSDEGSTNGRTVTKWRFYEKQKKDDKGNWVDF